MYINTQTNQYPVSEREIRVAHPNTSFPTPFRPPSGFEVVFPSPQPTHNALTETVRETAPVLTSKGHWEQRWEVVPLDQDVIDAKTEELAAAVRSTRNKRLAACDWTQLSDAQVNKDAWATYRQALRDVPAQPGFPFSVSWPSEPS